MSDERKAEFDKSKKIIMTLYVVIAIFSMVGLMCGIIIVTARIISSGMINPFIAGVIIGIIISFVSGGIFLFLEKLRINRLKKICKEIVDDVAMNRT